MNPYDELELDPRISPEELTEELRARAEKANPEEREKIQRLWRELTMRERDRVRWAFLAHPRPAEADPHNVEELREAVPPALTRQKPPPLAPTVADAVVFGEDSAEDTTDLPRPRAIFDD